MKKFLLVPVLLGVFSSVQANSYSGQNAYQNSNPVPQISHSQSQSRQGYSTQGQAYVREQQDYNQPQTQPHYQGQGVSNQQQAYHSQGQPYYYTENAPSQSEPSYYEQAAHGHSHANPHQDGSGQQQHKEVQSYVREKISSLVSSSDKYPNDRATSEKDKEINTKIRDKITGWVTDDYKDIALKTTNGVVLIEGTVATNEAKKKLNEEIWKINGVVSINDLVRVKPPREADEVEKEAAKYPQDRYETDADRRINIKIREKISGWFTNEYKNITLNTSNGNVSITGYVNSPEAQKRLTDEVRKIEGVKAVSNNAQVK